MACAISYSSIQNFEQSLQTAALELKYQHSNHIVDILSRDEDARKHRFEIHVLEYDNAELRGLLANEQETSEKLSRMVNEHLERAESAEAAVQSTEEALQTKEQEISSLRAEAKTLKNLTTDTSKIVTEKLELTHELSRLKPEVEHLRTQVAMNDGLLAEKLALQRQLSTMEVDIENAKRDAQRALAKRRNTMHEVQQEDEMDQLRKSLAKEKRCHEKAKETIEEFQAELKEMKMSAQNGIASETKQAEKGAEKEVRMEELSRELATEKKEKTKCEKALQKQKTEFETTKTILDDKLTQYKNRVRTLKDRLKETEASLEEAKTVAANVATSKPSTLAVPVVNHPGRKRDASSMDPDATTLGTPGFNPTKRARKGANVGEKSAFSITPFLNRTMNVDSDNDKIGEEEKKDEGSDKEDEVMNDSPSAEVKASKVNDKKKKQPLQPISTSKQNVKKNNWTLGKTTTTKILLKPVEEEDESSTNKDEQQVQEATRKSKPKIRKSLATFATFNFEPEPEKRAKKTRKLGGLGKTLFDEEDDVPAKAIPGGNSTRGFFAGLGGGNKIGPLAGGVGSKGGIFGSKKTSLMRVDDGFMFSPLKRDRKTGGASFLK